MSETSSSARPFARTVCGCAACVQCCKDQPGFLAPGDFERIAAYLGEPLETATQHFWASPGAVVMHVATGRQSRLGTITPRRVRGRCVFLTDEGQCRVHPVAPAGCGDFDTHMSASEGQRRSVWFMRQVAADPSYRDLRARLPFASHYQPKGY